VTEPLFINGKDARRLLGFGEAKFRRLVKVGAIPSWTDPSSNPERPTRYYSRLALEDWARRNGAAA
jgi:hypothetical protein